MTVDDCRKPEAGYGAVHQFPELNCAPLPLPPGDRYMAPQDSQTLNPPREEPVAEAQPEDFFALETFVGCPHCGCPVDARAVAARICRELAQTVFDRLNDGAQAIELL